MTIRLHTKRSLPPVDPNQIRSAPGELPFHRGIRRNFAHRVVPVNPVHAAALQPPRRPDELRQFVRKQNVDIGRQHELPAGAPYAGVLGDHLVERQRFAMVDSARAAPAVPR